MQATNKAPNVPVSKFKRTKIIATIGPATNSYEAVLKLITAGVNGVRLNFSHGTHEERKQQIAWIRKASKAYSKPVAIIQDLHGPKMQLGDFEGIVNVLPGQSLRFKYQADYKTTGILPIEFDFSKKVKRGERLTLYDGKIRTVITSIKDGVVHVKAENEGLLIKKKGINLPDTDFEGDIITAKDKKDLAFGSTQDFDYVALSFIQSAADIRAFRRILRNLNYKTRIITKVETHAAVQNLESIVQESDCLMVARGDLATETMLEAVPITQRQIIALGLRYAKPTIVATQMLASMVDNSEPTRAEVSDVATAVILGADCVMLSEETAIGRYPIETVEVMKRVILFTQLNNPVSVSYHLVETDHKTRQSAISEAILDLAKNVQAQAIVAETKSGATALQIAARRSKQPLIAVTSDVRVAQQLALVYGIKTYVRPDDKLAAVKLTNWLLKQKVLKKGDMVVTASGQYPGVVGTTDTIKVRVLE